MALAIFLWAMRAGLLAADVRDASVDLKRAVNPFGTTETFPAIKARYVRFTILKANGKERKGRELTCDCDM